MLKTKEQIEVELHKALPRSKPFYRECITILSFYDEDYLKKELSSIKAKIQVYMYRRKKSGDKKLYKDELKENRRFLKGIKYLLIREKKPRGKGLCKCSKKTQEQCIKLCLNE